MLSKMNDRNVRVVVSAQLQLPLDCLTAGLNSLEGIEVVASGLGDEATCRYVNGHQPDVVLTVPLPTGELMESTVTSALDCLNEHSDGSSLVVLSYCDDPEIARHSVRAGAKGYVLVNESLSALGEAVTTAAAGGIYINPRLLTEIAMLGNGHADGVTPRERDVLRLLALGYSNAEASEELFLSIRTIESYRAKIYEKLGISSRREVFNYARSKQLVP